MDVEIHDGHALGAIGRLRMKSSDGGVVEQAEAHGLIGFRVVSGRPDQAEGVPGQALHHLIDGLDAGARRAQGRLPALRRHDRIAVVERDNFQFRLGALDKVEIGFTVRPHDLLARRRRRFDAMEILKSLARQYPVDGPDPVRTLRVPLARVVFQKGIVGDVERRH